MLAERAEAQLAEDDASRFKELLGKSDGLSEEDAKLLQTYLENGYTLEKADSTIEAAGRIKDQYQGQYDTWKDGSELKTALHAAVGALQAGLAGGDVAAGAVGAGTSERMSELTAKLPPSVKPFASAILGAAAARIVGEGTLAALTGGATARYGYEYNRRLHETEQAVISRLAAEHWQEWGYVDEQNALARLLQAACWLVHCADGVPTASDDRQAALAYQAQGEKFEKEIGYLRQAAQEDYASEMPYWRMDPRRYVSLDHDSGRSSPVNLPERMFEYSLEDESEDFDTRHSIGTRTMAVAQTAGSIVPIGLGAGGIAACPESAGATCYLGWLSLGLGADQARTGLRTLWTGIPYATGYNQMLQWVGFSPEQANAIEFATNLGVQGQLSLDVKMFPYGFGGSRNGAPAFQTPMAGAVAERGRLVALDTDAVVKLASPEVQSALLPGDRLVVTPNVVQELRNSVGIQEVEKFLAARGIVVAPDTVGATVPASFLREQMDAVVGAARGNLGDGLNISQAGGIGADVFITGDANTIGRTFGKSGSVFLPHSGGVVVPITVAK